MMQQGRVFSRPALFLAHMTQLGAGQAKSCPACDVSDVSDTAGRWPGKGGQQRTMDLHGLHVNEAITQLANHISHARISSQLAPLSVIVGTGTHTKVTSWVSCRAY